MVNAHVEESKNKKYSTQIYDSTFQQDFLIKTVWIIETFSSDKYKPYVLRIHFLTMII